MTTHRQLHPVNFAFQNAKTAAEPFFQAPLRFFIHAFAFYLRTHLPKSVFLYLSSSSFASL